MGRRSEFEVEDVFAVAEKLKAIGENVTIEKVRRALGNTGSNSRISELLNQWKQNQKEGRAEQLSLGSKRLPDIITQATEKVFELIQQESAREIAKVKEEAEKKLHEISRENSELQTKVQQLQEILQRTELKNNHLDSDLTLTNQALADERSKNAIVNERVELLQKLVTELKQEMQERVDSLNTSHQTMVNHLKNQLTAFQETYQKEKDRLLEHNEQQRHSYIAEIDQLKVAKEKAEKAFIKIELELKQEKNHVKMVIEKSKSYEIDLITLKGEYKELQNQHVVLTKASYQMEKSYIKLKTEAEQKDILITELKQLNQQLKNLTLNKKKKNQNL